MGCLGLFWFLLLFALLKFCHAESECMVGECLYGNDFCISGRGCLYGCRQGYSGKNCDRTCSSGCVECLWDGYNETCTMCKPGKYGAGCTEYCSKNCKINQTKCDRFGHCLYGCNIGWRGERCDEEDCDFENCVSCGVANNYIYCSNCTTGKFWNITSHSCVNCSDFCKGGSLACNTTTGVCLNGCKHGYFGYNCDKICTIDHCNECKENYYHRMDCLSCDEGYYAENYQCLPCRGHCGNGEFCDKNTGVCHGGCAHGWYGKYCDRECLIDNCTKCSDEDYPQMVCLNCDQGFHMSMNGLICKECSSNCKGGQSACSNSDGRCRDGCELGFYGDSCETNCSAFCAGDGSCLMQDGYCTYGCLEGMYGNQCDRRCPTECRQCQVYIDTGMCSECFSGWYGTVCDQQCSQYCKRNAYSNFIHCDKDSGSCLEGCVPGYYGDFCNFTCSEHCSLKECYRENGKCKYPCSPFRFGDYCERTCPKNCKYQSPDRKACNEITMMCVYGCQDGFYGDYCNKTCPLNCEKSQCDRVSGICKECIPKFYGPLCNITCPVNCNKDICSRYDGSCTQGCSSNMFGKSCSSRCSSWCQGGTCFHQNGFCDQGCDVGRYGLECENTCSSNCQGALCEQMSGICTNECLEGWTGDMCDKKCIPGSFGSNCDQRCGVCKDNEACDYRNGACPQGCAEGWTGSTCQTALRSSNSLKDKNADTMAIAGSVTAAMLLTILTIVIVTIIVRRKHMHLCASCTKPQKSTNVLDDENHSPEEGVPLLNTICPWLRHQSQNLDENTYGFQMEGGTAIRNAGREFLSTAGQRNLDLHFLQVSSEASFLQMPLDISIRNGEYKHHAVLVKCLNRERNKNQRVRFKNEVDILRSLEDVNSCSNIFHFYGYCEDEKFEYSVFEKCDQGDLKQHLKQLRYSSENPPNVTFNTKSTELITHALDVLAGIIYLKEKKIIHRLVIPMNVYLFSNGRAKLANFYFAISSSSESQSDPVPRQYNPWLAVESKRQMIYSNQSEIWTFGVLLLEIVSLGYSFPREEGEFYLIPPKSCNKKLNWLMESCWSKSPASRPSCQEVYCQLQGIRHHLEVNQEDDSIVMTTMV